MATTALEINAETFVVECYQRRVEELTEVVASHSPRFRRIALRHLRNVDDAEDAVQDALLAALRHVDQFKGQAKMSTWVTTIVINSALMQLRRRLQQVPVSLDETDGEQNVAVSDVLPDTRLDPEHMYREREIVEILGHAIQRLSPALRRTFQLRAIEGLNIRETAHLLGVPVGTVKARLARARMKLKQAVKRNFREWNGGANTPTGKALKAKDLKSAAVQNQSDAELQDVITKGRAKMPALGSKFSPDVINSLVAYIRQLPKK